MDTKKYLRLLTKQVRHQQARQEIFSEYANHINDHKEVLMKQGLTEEAAIKEAIQQLGDPVVVGRSLNKIHPPRIDWQMTVYFLGWSLFFSLVSLIWNSSAPNFILNSIAGILMIAGFAVAGLEKYFGTALFYAWGENWDGGGLVNSGFILAMSMVPLTVSWWLKIFIFVALALLLTMERTFISHLQASKEQKLLWETGRALTNISYKGTGEIRQKKIKLKAREGEISKNQAFMVIGLEGFKPVVVGL